MLVALAMAGVIAVPTTQLGSAFGAAHAPAGTVTGTVTPTPTASATDTVTPTPSPTVVDHRLLPDLVSLPATGAYIAGSGPRRTLRFTSALGNVGRGPLEIRPNRNQACPRGQHNATQAIYLDSNRNRQYNATRDVQVARQRAGCMVYHPRHLHWHLNASARYRLFRPGAEPVVVGAHRKVSFCMRDSARVPRRLGSWSHSARYGACSAWTRQGIAVGWMDIYQSFLPGQFVPLPARLRPGVYCLETVVDPLNTLAEVRDDNNRSLRALRIRGSHVEPRPTRLCR